VGACQKKFMAVAPALSAISAFAETVDVVQSNATEVITAKKLFDLRVT
jgi:hypothetical protein